MSQRDSGYARKQHDGYETTASDAEGIISNPPYVIADRFITHALHLTEPHKGMVAMLLRCDFDHAAGRRHLFADCPAFARKVVLTKRIRWIEGSNRKPVV
jgi:hypothetical protein